LENASSMQETLLLARPGPVLGPVMTWSFHVGNGAIMLPLVIGLQNPRLIHVTRLLVLCWRFLATE
jgi:hypothetical protein